MDVAAVEDLFAPLWPVSCRRMFGGFGVFRGKLMIGLVAEGEFYLKAAPDDAALLTAAGARPFIYAGKVEPTTGVRKPVATSYWSVPPAVMEDDEAFRAAAERASMAARAAADRRVARLTGWRAAHEAG